jgi:(p)ppGpp synthase/HD superfamily hydrolase
MDDPQQPYPDRALPRARAAHRCHQATRTGGVAALPESKLISNAYAATARWHDGQTRKGADAAPYITHPVEVAALVADTQGTEEDIRTAFGPQVAEIVMEVTDDKTLPTAERKRLQLETTRAKSHAARLIMIADKTSNVRSITTNPPTDWSPERHDPRHLHRSGGGVRSGSR